MLPGERKRIEPMAARVHPENVRAAHQSLPHWVADAEWREGAVLAAVAKQGVPQLLKRDKRCGWMLDDTAPAKKGAAFGGGGASVLWALGQDRQLSGGSEPVAGQRRGQRPACVSALLA
jgi:DDE superfamily endonuclease